MENKTGDYVNINFAEQKSYGTIDNNEEKFTPLNSSTPKRMIYCVHGKVDSGCCTVLEGELEANYQSPDLDNDITHHAKENADTTSLVLKHCHKSKFEEVDSKARRKLILASILCVIFMIGEAIGGYMSGSLAIATDAAHLLSDFASFMISLFSIWVATRPATKKMSFGWYRAEVIGALISVLLIWVVTGILVYMAVQRVMIREFDIEPIVMLITSGVGLAVNIVMGLTLHQHGHTHGSKSEHGHNLNVRAAFIHVIGDFIQSFGVFLAALVIYYKPEWNLIDPICTFLFSILVLITTFSIIKDALLVLMEGIPKGIHFNDVNAVFMKIDGVLRVHNLHIWALSLDKVALSAHLDIKPGVNPQNVLVVATKSIHEKYDFFEMTLQIEEFKSVTDNCCFQQCP